MVHGRGLTLAVTATIALGVAALSATFAIVNAALVRQPPFHEPERLAMLFLERNPIGEGPRRERWSMPRFDELRRRQKSFEDVASYSPASVTLSSDQGGAALVHIERVSASYFPVLQVRAARGRVFEEVEDTPAATSAVAVISHALWTGQFAGDPAILGRAMRLNGVSVAVIGVLPEGFTGLSGRSVAWVPRTLSSEISYAEYATTNQNFIPAFGRLRAGVELAAARSELAVLGAEINRAMPSDPRHPDERVTATALALNEVRTDPTVRRSLLVLLGAVSLLHLLASANVINLLLGRAAARQREFAVRLALGSSPRRLFARLFAESAALAAIGGAAGIVLAWWVTSVATPPASLWATFFSIMAPFDAPVFGVAELVFGLAIAIVTAGVIALPPALSAFGTEVSRALQVGSRGVARGPLSLRRPSARGVIIGVEAALAALLVVASGLLLDSFQRMRRVDVGVEPERILTFWVVPSEARIPPEAAPEFVRRLLEAVGRAPGVESATVDGGGPLAGSASSTLYIQGRPTPAEGQAPLVTRHYVAPGHFRTLGIPVRRGRPFTEADTAGSPRVAVISESAARRFWPDEDPIGRRVWFGGGSNFDSPERSAEIVGVVADVRYQPFDRPQNMASFYTPYTQFTYAPRMVFVKTAGPPLSVLADVRRAVAGVDPELALQEVRPLVDLLSGSWARRRFDATLYTGFGLAALLLAASGLFAVLAHSVETRRREFGIRIALGARPWRVVRDVLGEGLAFPAIGLAGGLGAALAFTRLLEASLYETSAQDPRIFGVMAAVLLAASVLACLAPAWRATRADPIEALRAE